MRKNFPDALVSGTECTGHLVGLPDPDDEHVVTAAILGQAGVIVTENIKDFPDSKLPAGIEAKPAREFLADAVGISPVRALDAIESMSKRYMNPQLSVSQILKILEDRYHAVDAVEMLRQA